MAEASTQSAPLDIDALLAKGKPADGYGPASEAPLDIDAILAKGKQAESYQQSEPLDIDALIAKGDEYRKNKLLATAPAPETKSLFARMAGKAPKTTSDQSVAGGGGPVLPPITQPSTAPAQMQPTEQPGIMDAVSKGVTDVLQKPISGLGTVRWAADLLDKATDTNMQKAGVDAFIKAVVPFNLYKPDALPAPRNVAEERINKISETAGTMAGTAASFLIPGKVVTFGLSKIPGAIKAVESLAKFPILQKVVSGVMHNVPTFALRDQVYNDIATGPQERWDIAKDSAKSGVMFGALPALEKLGKAGVALEPLAVFGIGYGGDFGKQDLSTTDRIVSGLSLLLMHYGGKANNMVTAKEKAVKVLEAQGFNPEQAIAITDKVAETVAPAVPTESAPAKLSEVTAALEQQRPVNIPETQAKVEPIKDESGSPLVVYHGSPVPVESFQEGRTAFFSSKKKLAEEYTANRGLWRTPSKTPFMAEANLVMNKPLVIDALGTRNDNIPVPWKQWKPKVFGNLPKDAVSIQEAAKYAKENGYDGLIVKNVIDTADTTSKTKSDVYAVFSPKQIIQQNQPMTGPNAPVSQPADLPTLRDNAKAMGLPTEGTAKGVADRIQERMDGEKAAAGDVETIVKKSERDPDKRQFPQRVAEQNPEMTESINSLDLSYAKLKDKDAIDQARREIDADPAKAEAEIGNAKDPLAFTKAVILIDEAAAKGDVDKVVRLVNEFMPQTTNVAQALQKLSVLGRTTPAGMLKYLGRQVSDAAKKLGKQKPDSAEVESEIGKAEKEVGKQAVESAVKELDDVHAGSAAKPKSANGRATEPVWSEYKKETADKVAEVIDAALAEPKPKGRSPALAEFVNRMQHFILEGINVPITKPKARSVIDATKTILEESRNNPEKYTEAIAESRKYVREHYKDDPVALEAVDNLIGNINVPSLTAGRIRRVTKEGMKDLAQSVGDIIGKPYASAQEAKKALVDHIVARLGTTVEDSVWLAEKIRMNVNQMSNKAKVARLNALLKPKTEAAKKEVDKLAELSNMSEQAPAEITELVDKALDIVVGVEGRLNRADKTAILEFMRAAQKAKSEGNGREHDLNVMRAMAVATQKMPADRLAQISTVQILSQLLNVKTVGRNLYGNTLFAGAENVSKAMSAAFDVLISKVTGERTTSLPNLKAQKTGLIRGAKEAFQEVMEGLSRPGTEGKFDLQTAHQFKGKFMQALEKGLGLTLRVPDRAFFESAYSDSLARQMKAAKTTKATPEMIERAIYDGEYATFQDNNYASTFFSGLKSLLNGGKKFGIGDLVIKYPKTPGSLIAKGVDYSPVGIAKGLFDLAKPLIGKQMNQYSAALSLGRGVVGTSVILGFYALAKAGIATGIGDEDKKAAALGRATGTGRYKLNLSALKRWVLGGFTKEAARRQDGDMMASYDWALPLSIPASMGASSGENTATGKDVLGGVVNAIESGTDTLAQQPLITGVRRFAAGSRGPTESSLDAVMETLASAPASFVPTVLSQLRQYTDPTIRDVKDDSIVKTGVNMVSNKLPGFSRLVKPKIDVFGEDVKIDNPSVWNIFANPAITSELKNYPGAEMILNLFDRSGGYSAAFPRVIDPKEITWRGKILPLTIGEQIEVKRLIGKDVLERLNEKADNYTGDEDPIRFSDNIAQYILNPARTRAVNAVVSGIDADEKDRRIEKHKEEKKR